MSNYDRCMVELLRALDKLAKEAEELAALVHKPPTPTQVRTYTRADFHKPPRTIQ